MQSNPTNNQTATRGPHCIRCSCFLAETGTPDCGGRSFCAWMVVDLG